VHSRGWRVGDDNNVANTHARVYALCSDISFIKLKREHAIALTSSGVKCRCCQTGNSNANAKKQKNIWANTIASRQKGNTHFSKSS
jgi:hypothetical protein